LKKKNVAVWREQTQGFVTRTPSSGPSLPWGLLSDLSINADCAQAVFAKNLRLETRNLKLLADTTPSISAYD